MLIFVAPSTRAHPAAADRARVPPGARARHLFEQEIGGGRLFVHAPTDRTPIAKMLRQLSSDQPIEHAAALDVDVIEALRAE